MPAAPNATRTTEIGQWRRALSRHVWFLRCAGISSSEIERAVATSLRLPLSTRERSAQPADEPMYPRILAHWQHAAAYLDSRGQPRALRFDGQPPTFRSLVRAAAPGADASRILVTLRRYRLVSQGNRGTVRLIINEPLPCRVPRGTLLSTTLASLEGLTDTCYANLNTGRAMRRLSRFQGRAYTEYLDPHHLRAYEEFFHESAQVFIAMHETWLKRHEVKPRDHRSRRGSRIGVEVFAIRGH
jgi:hypothetical protein